MKNFFYIIFMGNLIFFMGCIGDPIKVESAKNTFKPPKSFSKSNIANVYVHDSTKSQENNLVWEIGAVEKIQGKDLQVAVGEIPIGFIQKIPDFPNRFKVIPGRTYDIIFIPEYLAPDHFPTSLTWIGE